MTTANKIKISLGITALMITGIVLAKIIKKPKTVSENSAVDEPIPNFTVRKVNKNDAGFVYSVEYTFGDTMDKYTAFDNSYSVEPYSSKKSMYTLKTVTSQTQDGNYGTIYLNLYKNGTFVKSLYSAA